MFRYVRCFAVIFFLSSPLVAGTIVEVQSKGELMSLLTDGQQARVNMSGDEYVIVNYKNHSVKVVSPQKQQVMLLNVDEMASGNNSARINTAIKNMGPAQTIAGYRTQKFDYAANGKSCGVIYGSKDAYQAKGIKNLLGAMKAMMEKQLAELGGLAGMLDDCILADMKISDHVNTVGVPMRTEKNGRVDTEIKSIKVDIAIPADTFVIPASYKTVTIKGQMLTVEKDMVKVQQQMQQRNYQTTQPQMQQTGQLTPEMMEQMRRSQQMMRQYPQY